MRDTRLRSPLTLILTTALLVALTGCERQPPPPPTPTITPTPEAAAPAAPPAPAVAKPAAPAAPAILATEPFIERRTPEDLRVVSWNVKWDAIFADVDEAAAVKFGRVIRALGPDVLALQEVKRPAEDVVTLLNELLPLPDGGTWYAFSGQSNVIASRWPLSLTADQMEPDAGKRRALALVDLPDERFPIDLYVTNHHFKCCGEAGGAEDKERQAQADAIVAWFRDARTPGGAIDLPPHTGLLVVGDLNIVGGPEPLQTVITGSIIDTATFGQPTPPDWDGTSLTDAAPRHNAQLDDQWTWRDDGSAFPPGRLDYIIYSDSVLDTAHSFALDTTTMAPALLTAAGLETYDVTHDDVGREYDHLPLVVDFRVRPLPAADSAAP